MNGIDTSMLIRYLVVDDEAQAAKAKRYIESGSSHVSCIVLSEIVWVLESAYGYDKGAVIMVLERLLSTHEVEVGVEDADMALAALHDHRRSIAGFADCLIGRRNAAHGCSETGSFDKRAKGVAGFKMLQAILSGNRLFCGVLSVACLSIGHHYDGEEIGNVGLGEESASVDWRNRSAMWWGSKGRSCLTPASRTARHASCWKGRRRASASPSVLGSVGRALWGVLMFPTWHSEHAY
jgi:predicted nucleic-acid-binding protein